MKFVTLEGCRVAVWGLGREGRAALAAWRRRLPGQSITLFCHAQEAASLSDADHVEVRTEAPDAAVLSGFDFVIKSPGISIYKPEIVAAQKQGTVFTSGTALWFGENPDARVIGITGTKGKSTTAALTAHLARAAGVRTALAGNIGLPLLELDGRQADLWVVELSSFQTGEAGPLDVGVVTSLYEEHLDWHGSRERYVADKLKLADVSRILLVNAMQPRLLELTADHPRRVLFGHPDGWHVGASADAQAILHGEQPLMSLASLPIPGRHNALNACAALTALEQAGIDIRAAIPALATFQPLPHRLQHLGRRDGFDWINDSISTTPQAVLAALDSLEGRRITLILGGHDRGLDWSGFVEAMVRRTRLRVVTQGASGPRIAAAMREAGEGDLLHETTNLDAAIATARTISQAGDSIVLSPGAPSFDQFHDYTERGRRFADLAGFDGEALGAISNLGIA
ncbi:MAG TPA: UDP-N-acetylmuramoyl-L-alanine--D-glutamate ligase [Oleiagrimonas sp.]|nr:UDP-N-acetylmuramoyl-L-alanine--D-glutamate ligase [Oleiagrimonas sp.]